MKKFQKLLDENDADVLNGDDLDDLFARFSEQLPDESIAGDPETAEDYIELAKHYPLGISAMTIAKSLEVA